MNIDERRAKKICLRSRLLVFCFLLEPANSCPPLPLPPVKKNCRNSLRGNYCEITTLTSSWHKLSSHRPSFLIR